MDCCNEYKQKLSILESLGGDITRNYNSVYEIDLEIIRIISSTMPNPPGSSSVDSDYLNQLNTRINGKQDKLIPGDNISITDNVISVTDLNLDNICCIDDDDSGSTTTTYSASKIETAIQNQLGEFADRLADTEEKLINERVEKIIDDKYDLEDYLNESDEGSETLPTKSTLSTQMIYKWFRKYSELWDSTFANLIQTSINDYDNSLKNELENAILAEINKSITELQEATSKKVNGGSISQIWVGSQTEYNALENKNNTTLYIVK